MYYNIFSRILNTLGQDFQNLAEMCLLVMHLEIRCHCFYFLLQALKQVQYVVKRKYSLYSSPPLYIKHWRGGEEYKRHMLNFLFTVSIHYLYSTHILSSEELCVYRGVRRRR